MRCAFPPYDYEYSSTPVGINVHEAKTTLLQLLSAGESGEEVVIARNGMPVAKLVPVVERVKRELGMWRKFPGWEHFKYDPSILAVYGVKTIGRSGRLVHPACADNH